MTKTTTEELIRRIEAVEGDWAKSSPRLAIDIFEFVFPQPEQGPWFWPKKQWSRWEDVRMGIWNMHRHYGGWLYLLGFVYLGKMPAKIPSDPKRALTEALQHIGDRKGTIKS